MSHVTHTMQKIQKNEIFLERAFQTEHNTAWAAGYTTFRHRRVHSMSCSCAVAKELNASGADFAIHKLKKNKFNKKKTKQKQKHNCNADLDPYRVPLQRAKIKYT